MSDLLKELPGLNIYQFQNQPMLILRFSFEGHRNMCASYMPSSLDLAHELELSADMLTKCYPSKAVRAIEIVAYERGSFDYFTWPEGLELLHDAGALTTLAEGETEKDGLRDPQETDTIS